MHLSFFTRFNVSPLLDLEVIAQQCPLTLTGADFYALCSDAMLGAIKRKIASLEAGSLALLSNFIQISLQPS